ncbi:MAG: ABC transporter permease [Bryobacterales bacterium]|nr:ABC transporter permease [Bryobacteraceae bacterium]MDW8129572.1 ABC transporter permease [Bryobacterales bacterium]
MSGTASLWEAVSVAAASLRSSKLRSFLTLLGIILATATLIAVISVIHGMDVYIAETVSDMGVDGFRVDRFPVTGRFDPKKFVEMLKKNPELNPAEFDFLRTKATLVSAIGMQASRRVPVACGSEQMDDIVVSGVSPNIAAITNTRTALGRFFVESDDRRRLAVAFIGNDIKEKCFPSVDPIGRIVRVEGRPFEVIGVARAMGSVFGQSRDAFVMIPIQTYFKMFGSRRGLRYAAKAIGPEYLYQAQDEIRMLIRAWRGLRPGQEDNFGVFSSDTLVERWNQLTGAIAATAIGVVSVFMVVGGVVIMNIMMAVVTERTHEIGIRKSVGARQRDILQQFLVESALLAAAGGVIGVLLAWAVSLAVRNLTPVPSTIPVYAVALGVGLSATVGLFFGIYPARTAARMDPIAALRFEK